MMENNNLLNFYNTFVSRCDLEVIYNMLDNIHDVLILSNSDNIKVAEFWSIILNHKFSYITAADSFTTVNDSKLKVYKNVIVLDSETEEFVQKKGINGNVIFINQFLKKIVESTKQSKIDFILTNFIMGLLVYYGDKTLDILKNTFYKLALLKIDNIYKYDIVVCNGFINCGINLFNHKFKTITFISFIDQNKNYDNVLYFGSFSQEEREIISRLDNNADIISCEFNDEIEQIIYGAFLAITKGDNNVR